MRGATNVRSQMINDLRAVTAITCRYPHDTHLLQQSGLITEPEEE